MSTSDINAERLCLAPGPWQLIMLEAALRERSDKNFNDTLVLFEFWGGDQLRSWMERIAKALRPWKKIVWGNVLFNPGFSEEQWPWPVRQVSETIQNELKLNAPSQLWMGHLGGRPYKWAMETYPHAPVSLYEDGFMSPVPVWRMGWRYCLRNPIHLLTHAWRGTLADHVRSDRIATWLLPKIYTDRVSKLYTCTGPKADLPEPYSRFSRKEIRPEIVMSVLRDVVRALDIKIEGDFGENDILLLAQPLEIMMQNDRPYRRELEVDLYRSVLRELVDKGYRVWWKDHPRQNASIFNDIKKDFDGLVQRLPYAEQLPIELFFTVKKINTCVAMTSSSLFYLPRLFGVNAYTFADRVVPLVSPKRANFLALGRACSLLTLVSELPRLSKKD